MRLHNIGYLSKSGLKGIFTNKMMTLASIGSLTACFLLIGFAVIFAFCINQVMDVVGRQNEMIVYLSDTITDADAQSLNQKILEFDAVEKTEFRTSEENLLLMCERLGETPESLLNAKEDNPFLASITVRATDPALYEDVIKEIKKMNGVENVQGSPDVARMLSGFQKVTLYISIVLVGILLVVSSLIVFNTIKLTIFHRRKEISIMKYVGATDSFIRIPFVVEGMAIGAISASISVAILYFSSKWLLDWAYEWAASRVEIGFILECINISEIWILMLVAFLVTGGIIGSIGGGRFVRKYTNV